MQDFIKIHSLVTTLNMLIYMKNNFITGNANYTDFRNYIKNNFTSGYAVYVDFKDYVK